jgi:hypothetical protein
LLSAVAVAATVTGYCVLLSSASAAESDAGAASDMAVTVARTTNVCFTDTLQVTGVVVPRNEILVRPDREGLQISQVLVEPGDTVVCGAGVGGLTPPERPAGRGNHRRHTSAGRRRRHVQICRRWHAGVSQGGATIPNCRKG